MPARLLAVLLLLQLLVPWQAAAQQVQGGAKKPPIFIVPGFAASSLLASFAAPTASNDTAASNDETTPNRNTTAGGSAAAPLDGTAFEALLLATAGRNSTPKVESTFFSIDDTNSSNSISGITNTNDSTINNTVADRGTNNLDKNPAAGGAASRISSDTFRNQPDSNGAVPAATPADAAAAALVPTGCPAVSFRDVDIWLPALTLPGLAPNCWKYLMQLRYNSARPGTEAAYANNSNVQVSVFKPSMSGGMRYPLFGLAGYDRLINYIEAQFNYTRGANLFALPYDFRLDCDTLKSSGQLQLLAKEIIDEVERSGQQAILIGHSTGAIVSVCLLQDPQLRNMVQGFIALSPPFGGSTAAVLARISGAFDYLLPWLADELQTVIAGSAVAANAADQVREWMYQITQGMPSVAMMMPYVEAFGAQTVAVSVGNGKMSYKVGDLARLLRDINETALAASYNASHSVPSMLQYGPYPGIRTFCIYGNTTDTPLSWSYDQPLQPGQANEMPKYCQQSQPHSAAEGGHSPLYPHEKVVTQSRCTCIGRHSTAASTEPLSPLAGQHSAVNFRSQQPYYAVAVVEFRTGPANGGNVTDVLISVRAMLSQ